MALSLARKQQGEQFKQLIRKLLGIESSHNGNCLPNCTEVVDIVNSVKDVGDIFGDAELSDVSLKHMKLCDAYIGLAEIFEKIEPRGHPNGKACFDVMLLISMNRVSVYYDSVVRSHPKCGQFSKYESSELDEIEKMLGAEYVRPVRYAEILRDQQVLEHRMFTTFGICRKLAEERQRYVTQYKNLHKAENMSCLSAIVNKTTQINEDLHSLVKPLIETQLSLIQRCDKIQYNSRPCEPVTICENMAQCLSFVPKYLQPGIAGDTPWDWTAFDSFVTREPEFPFHPTITLPSIHTHSFVASGIICSEQNCCVPDIPYYRSTKTKENCCDS